MKRAAPTVFRAPQRLRAIAHAIEGGKSLTDVATKFRVPLRALQRVVTPKRSLRRPSEVITPEMLRGASRLIRAGHTFSYAAAVFKVKTSTLTATMLKHGLSARNLRPPSIRDKNLDLAIADYRQGVKVPEISRGRGIPERTLYSHLRKQGVPLRQNRRQKPGYPSRLDRDFGRKAWGDEGYAREELVAELGSAFLCADLELTPEVRDDHASYIASWLDVLKNDKRAIVQAASYAQKAVDFLYGLQKPRAEAA